MLYHIASTYVFNLSVSISLPIQASSAESHTLYYSFLYESGYLEHRPYTIMKDRIRVPG